MERSCCFTGYRPEKFPFPLISGNPRFEKFKADVYDCIYELLNNNVRTFYCGMATGFDLICGRLIAEIRNAAPEKGIRLIACLPYRSHGNNFSHSWAALHNFVLAEADEKVLISNDYTRDCFDKRNRYMVDLSRYVICYYDGKSGGTANTVRYARARGRDIINVADYKIEGTEFSSFQFEL